MSFALSEKLKNMTPYEPVSGTYNIRLDANESFVLLPEQIRAEFAQRLETTALNRYPDPLAAEVCEKFADYYGLEANLVTAGNGSDELINVIVSAFLSEGGRLLTIQPDFSMYSFYAELAGAEVVSLGKDEELHIDVDAVIRAAKEKEVSCVMFSNPCNPTGQGLTREQVRKLVSSLDCLVVLDEAYMDFYTESLLSEVTEYDNLIILRTCSKALGMAAVRLGFAVANPVLTKALRAVKSPYNVNSLTQAYGAVLLSHKAEEQQALQSILKSRDELYHALKELQRKTGAFETVFPTVTNFVLVKTTRAKEIFEKLKERSIVIRYMGAYLRITAGSPEENQALMTALAEILKQTEE